MTGVSGMMFFVQLTPEYLTRVDRDTRRERENVEIGTKNGSAS